MRYHPAAPSHPYWIGQPESGPSAPGAALRLTGIAAITGGVLPDLRKSARLQDANLWRRAVLGGELASLGMRRFERYLTPADAELIRSYVARQAAMQYEAERAGEHRE